MVPAKEMAQIGKPNTKGSAHIGMRFRLREVCTNSASGAAGSGSGSLGMAVAAAAIAGGPLGVASALAGVTAEEAAVSAAGASSPPLPFAALLRFKRCSGISVTGCSLVRCLNWGLMPMFCQVEPMIHLDRSGGIADVYFDWPDLATETLMVGRILS